MNRKDYLTEGDRVEMTWAGKGAGRLELEGVVEQEQFLRLCKGKHPVSNEKLMVRDNGAHRRVCYFGQISAPKDVSIAYLVGGDQRIADWWRESVKETLREIEGVTATRVHEGNKVTDRPSEMVAAVVTHDTSRALDPQLHTHVCVMNMTFDSVEKRWKAVEPHGYYKYQSYLREVSYNKLAEKMKEGGYQLEKARSGGFTVKGFPGDLRKTFSKRREEIERVVDVLKTRDQDRLQSIATNTRAKKVHLDPAELSRRWKSEAAPHLAGIEKVIRSTETSFRSTPITPENALSLAVSHVFDRHSIVDERLLLREALTVGRGDVALDQLKDDLKGKIESGEVIRSGKMVTNPEMLALEKSVVSWATDGRNTLPPAGLYRADKNLSHEQNRAVEKLLNSGDRVSVLIGDAGAGKSTTLPAFTRGVYEAGGLTFACAPSANAAQELQDKLKIPADTVQQLLVNEKLQEQMSGRTLLVDEAGLLSVRQMHKLFFIAERQKCRVLLVGDVKQHHSVEAGDALRTLQKHAGLETIRLKEIHRQKRNEYKKVVKLLAEKKPCAAFAHLDRLGGVHEEKDWNKLLNQAAVAYVDKIAQGQSCLAMSPVWSEVNAFTAVLRDQLKDKGLLGRDEKTYKAVQSMQWTPAAKMQPSNYQVGDFLTFHRDSGCFRRHEMAFVAARHERELILERRDGSRTFFDPQKHKGFDVGLPRDLAVASGERLLVRANFAPGRLKNGDIVTVKEIDGDGSLSLQDGRTIPTHFRQFTHGYASTSHSAQSKTVDHGILILGEKGFQAANLQQAYVSNSRFQRTQTIFATDKDHAFDTMARFEERPLAVEGIRPHYALNYQNLAKEKSSIPEIEKINPPTRQAPAEPLDWNPLDSTTRVRV